MTDKYYKTTEITLEAEQLASEDVISDKYDNGYLFGRVHKGYMYQTRSLRISLENFEFNSENRRVLRKNENLILESMDLPVKLDDYNWQIHKLAKHFYTEKFGDGTFTASKIKSLITNQTVSNFNSLLTYRINGEEIGYCIAYQNSNIMHYCYPFYDFVNLEGNTGMGMMLRAIEHAMNAGLKYIYLGSLSRPEDRYKLQFNNLEWFDQDTWNRDLDKIKQILP